MDKNKNTFLEKLKEIGILPNYQGLEYAFDPNSNSMLKLSWQSPNDGLINTFDLVFDPKDKSILRIKDKH